MKNRAIYLSLLFILAITIAEASVYLPVVPFREDEIAQTNASSSLQQASLSELRWLVQNSDEMQLRAAEVLIEKGDSSTITRLVYAMRQGNAAAEQILYANASAQMVPFLLEDVAHGSLESYSGMGGDVAPIGRVRVAATAIVTEALSRIEGLPPETTTWLRTLKREGNARYQYVPEQSKIIIDWWQHNGFAILSGRNADAAWLPENRELIRSTFLAWENSRRMLPPPLPPDLPPEVVQPISATPIKLSEPFDAWVDRVSSAATINLTVAPVNFGGIEADEVSPDKGANSVPSERRPTLPLKEQMQSRSTVQMQKNSSIWDAQILWTLVTVVIAAAIGLLWLLLKRRS